VNGVSARPPLEFFERLAEVVQDRLVDELDGSVRCQNRNESGNPVDDVVEGELAVHGALVTASFMTPTIASVRSDVRSRETFEKGYGMSSEGIRDADALASPKSSNFLNAPFFWPGLTQADIALRLFCVGLDGLFVSGREGGIRTRDLSVPNRRSESPSRNDFDDFQHRVTTG
jgi:hypothetical protein